MSGFSSIWKLNLQMTPRDGWRGAAEGKPAVIPDWAGPLFRYASDRVARTGCKARLLGTGCSLRA